MISREMCTTDLILYSDRLRLAPLDFSDLDLCMQLFSDSKVTKYASAAMKMGGLSAMLPYWIKRGGNGCIGIWSISDRNKGVKLGIIALLPLPIDDDDTDFDLVVTGQMPDGDIEIRYFLLPSAWSNGYATEACTRIIKFVFERTPLKEIVATFDPANSSSKNVLKKAGFVDHGLMRCYGGSCPNFRIKRDDWRAREGSI